MAIMFLYHERSGPRLHIRPVPFFSRTFWSYFLPCSGPIFYDMLVIHIFLMDVLLLFFMDLRDLFLMTLWSYF